MECLLLRRMCGAVATLCAENLLGIMRGEYSTAMEWVQDVLSVLAVRPGTASGKRSLCCMCMEYQPELVRCCGQLQLEVHDYET